MSITAATQATLIDMTSQERTGSQGSYPRFYSIVYSAVISRATSKYFRWPLSKLPQSPQLLTSRILNGLFSTIEGSPVEPKVGLALTHARASTHARTHSFVTTHAHSLTTTRPVADLMCVDAQVPWQRLGKGDCQAMSKSVFAMPAVQQHSTGKVLGQTTALACWMGSELGYDSPAGLEMVALKLACDGVFPMFFVATCQRLTHIPSQRWFDTSGGHLD